MEKQTSSITDANSNSQLQARKPSTNLLFKDTLTP